MKRNYSQLLPTQKTDNVVYDKDINTLKGNIQKNPTGISSINNMTNMNHFSEQDIYVQFTKLSNLIKQIYVDIKNKILLENSNIIPLIKTTYPMDIYEDNEMMKTDAFILIQDIQEIFLALAKSKYDIEKQLDEEIDRKANEYEPMLQKLEAETRQHIKIEQQMRLYVESTQSKAEEMEKQNEQFKKDLEIIKQEFNQTKDKYKKKEIEIESLKNELRLKMETIHNLEQQTEAILGLKNKIRQLERSSKHEASKSWLNKGNSCLPAGESTEDHTKSGGLASQRTLLLTGDMNKTKQSLGKDKDNMENIKRDIQRDNVNFKPQKGNHIQDNTNRMDKSSSMIKNDEADSRNKKSNPLDNLMNKERLSSHDINQDERNVSNNYPLSWRENIENTQRNSMKNKNSMPKQNYNANEEYDYDKKKRNSYNEKQNDIQAYYARKMINQHSNNIPKSSKTNEFIPNNNNYIIGESSKIAQQYQSKKDNVPNAQELKAKMISPKKSLQDVRSNSVDGTNKFFRQFKTKIENFEKENQQKPEFFSKADSHVNNNDGGNKTNSNTNTLYKNFY